MYHFSMNLSRILVACQLLSVLAENVDMRRSPVHRNATATTALRRRHILVEGRRLAVGHEIKVTSADSSGPNTLQEAIASHNNRVPPLGPDEARLITFDFPSGNQTITLDDGHTVITAPNLVIDGIGHSGGDIILTSSKSDMYLHMFKIDESATNTIIRGITFTRFQDINVFAKNALISHCHIFNMHSTGLIVRSSSATRTVIEYCEIHDVPYGIHVKRSPTNVMVYRSHIHHTRITWIRLNDGGKAAVSQTSLHDSEQNQHWYGSTGPGWPKIVGDIAPTIDDQPQCTEIGTTGVYEVTMTVGIPDTSIFGASTYIVEAFSNNGPSLDLTTFEGSYSVQGGPSRVVSITLSCVNDEHVRLTGTVYYEKNETVQMDGTSVPVIDVSNCLCSHKYPDCSTFCPASGPSGECPDLTSDVMNCGACGRECPDSLLSLSTEVATCNAGTCEYQALDEPSNPILPPPTTIYTLSGQNYLGKVNTADGSVETYASINDSDSNFKALACGGSELYGITGGDNPRIVKIVETSENSGIYETRHVVSIPKAEQTQPDPEKLLPHAVAVDPTRPRFMYVTNSDDITKRLWRIDLLGQAPFESYDLTGGRRKIENRIEDLAFAADGTLYGINSALALYDIDKNRPTSPTTRLPVVGFWGLLLSDFPDSKAMAISGDGFLYMVSWGTDPLQVTESSLSNITANPSTPMIVPAPVEVGPDITEEVISATSCKSPSLSPHVEEAAVTKCSNFIECENGWAVRDRNIDQSLWVSCKDACLSKTAELRGKPITSIDALESNCCVGTGRPLPWTKDEYPCKGFTGKVCADEGQKSCYAVNVGFDQIDADPSSLDISSSACTDARIGEVVNGCIGQRACLRVGRPRGGMVGGVGKVIDACIGNDSCSLMASDNTRGHFCPAIDEVISSCKFPVSCSHVAWGGNRGEYTGSVHRVSHSCNAYKACSNALQDPDLSVPNVNINEINGACNRPFSCITYSRNQDLICECPDIHRKNAEYISKGWNPPFIYCQAYGSPHSNDPCLNPDGSVATCGQGTCGLSSPPPPTCTDIGPIEDPDLLPGGATETTIGDDEGMPSGVVHTYNIPYLNIPNIIWRLESAFLTMNGNSSSGTFLISNCNRDGPRLIVCTGYITVGLDGEAVECRLHIKLVFPTPVDVIFKTPDTSSTVPYLDVADLGGIFEFTTQTEIFVYKSGLIPARLYFNNLQPPLPEELYRSSVNMAFYYEPTSFIVPCPSIYPSFLACVAANDHYLALDRTSKKWGEHMEDGNAYGLSLVTAGEGESSEANSRVKMALSALSTIESIDNGVWFAGKYNTADSRWEYPDGSIIEFVANPTADDYCALYDVEGPFGWANDSCDSYYMAIFEVPTHSFRMSPAGSCQIPTISFAQTGDTITLSLLDPMGRSTAESDVSFSIAQTINNLTPAGTVGEVILGIQANGENTQPQLEISTDDSDADPGNELQDLFVIQNAPGPATLKLTDPANPLAEHRTTVVEIIVDDDDSNPMNEFQTLALNDNPPGSANLTLNPLNPPSDSELGPTSTVLIDTNDNDSDPENEIQSISITPGSLPEQIQAGEVDIVLDNPYNNASPSTVTISINDTDADPKNEIQYLTRNYDQVSITGTDGNPIDLGHLNKFSLPFYLSVGDNKQKNVFGHPFGATSFAAPYALEYSAYSILVTDKLPSGCNLEINVEFSGVDGDLIQSEVLRVEEEMKKTAGAYTGTNAIEIPQLGEIAITSVNTVGKCNGMNSESVTVLLIFRVLG